ncbi:MAG TPA: chorismate mutase [Aliidongia sp.]|nr:chorismate mutase [Aliidongia sp.]
MTIDDQSLAGLRQQIDRIDEQLHDLVMARADIAERIRQLKDRNGVATIHPAREIDVLRRLARRHHGPLPFSAVTRIWRELIAAITHLQRPLAIAVYAPDELPGPWDLARDHFGSTVPITPLGSVSQVIRAVTDKTATVGILPMPAEHEPDPWWRHLISVDPAAPRIFARLPVGVRGNARGAGSVFAIASHVGDFSAVDKSLVALEIQGPISRTKLVSGLKNAGLDCDMLAVLTRDSLCWVFAEIAGPVADHDPRLDELGTQFGTPINGVYHLGGYADPVLPAEA